MEHTLAQQNKLLSAELAVVKSQVTTLTSILKDQITSAAATSATTVAVVPEVTPQTTHIGVVHVTNVTQVNTIVNIKPFDGDGRLYIPVALLKSAFTENPRLMEYCRMSDADRTNAAVAAPFILEALVDLVRRAHHDPMYRNVHLNQQRSDQVMVCIGDDQRWEVRGFIDVIRMLFDGVAGSIHKIITTDQERAQLPLDVQSAASWVPNMYEIEPDKFVREGKTPMAAHLANIGVAK